MTTPQDWAPYSSLAEAARVYLRDPDMALEHLRGVVDSQAVTSFIMSRGETTEPWGDALWQEVVLTDGRRLIMWRASDERDSTRDEQRQTLSAAVRTIALSSFTDQILTTEYEVLQDGTRRLSEVHLKLFTQLVNRSRQYSATETTLYCESFRYSKTVDNGGLAQMERLIQFGRTLSRYLGV